MDKTEQTIDKFLTTHNIYKKTLVLGYSGGEDSTCLLLVLKKLAPKYSLKIIAAHLNHNWRGEEAVQEQENCREIANKLNIEFYTETLPQQEKCTELNARNARYDFFKRCLKKYDTQILFTAHSKTDNAETILYRIIKGTGINGLQGIPAIRKEKDYTIYRPMLNITREEVIAYNKKNNLSTNCDSSNFDTKYARNNIRQNIFPLLKKINPNIQEAIINLIETAQEESDIVNEYLQILRKKIFNDEKILTQEFLKSSIPVQKKILFELIKNNKENYDKRTIENIYNFICENKDSKSGKLYSVTKNCYLFVSKKHIFLTNEEKPQHLQIRINSEGVFFIENYKLTIEKIKNYKGKMSAAEDFEIFVDLSKINFPLTLRNRLLKQNEADFIQPFGMKGTMKLKKYFINKNINRFQKEKILLLCKDNEILWAAGVGISEKLRVTNTPTHRIILTELYE